MVAPRRCQCTLVQNHFDKNMAETLLPRDPKAIPAPHAFFLTYNVSPRNVYAYHRVEIVTIGVIYAYVCKPAGQLFPVDPSSASNAAGCA